MNLIKENILLTDFSSNRWNKKVNLDQVKDLLDPLYKEAKSKKLFGELNNIDKRYIDLTNVSYIIARIELKDYCIYGDIKFLNTPSGEIAQDLFLKNNIQFKMGC